MISIRFVFGVGLVLLALAVWLLSTLYTARNAKGPREKAFVIRMGLLFWVLLLVLLGLVYWLPPPFSYIAAALYFLATPFVIYKAAMTHQLIRIVEQRESNGSAG